MLRRYSFGFHFRTALRGCRSNRLARGPVVRLLQGCGLLDGALDGGRETCVSGEGERRSGAGCGEAGLRVATCCSHSTARASSRATLHRKQRQCPVDLRGARREEWGSLPHRAASGRAWGSRSATEGSTDVRDFLFSCRVESFRKSGSGAVCALHGFNGILGVVDSFSSCTIINQNADRGGIV